MYIEQGFKGELGKWKYFIFPIFFFGLIVLNFLAITLLDLDTNEIIQQEIENKGENRFLVETLIPFTIGLGILLFWVKYVHKQTLASLTTARNKVNWKRVFFAFGLWGLITAAMIFIDYYMAPEKYLLNFDLQSFLILAVIGVLLIPLQTSFEEYLFRGYLMQGIGILVRNRWFPLLLTSLIFGLLHIANPEVEKIGYIIMVYYIGTGLFLGIITLMDDGIELALGFHAANNLVSALLVTADWTAFQTNSVFKDISEPIAGWDIIIPVVIVYPILIFIFAKKYKWSGWKDKLFGKVSTPV